MHYVRIFNIPTPVWMAYESFCYSDTCTLHDFNRKCLELAAYVDLLTSGYEETAVIKLMAALGIVHNAGNPDHERMYRQVYRALIASISLLEYVGLDPYDHSDTISLHEGLPWKRYVSLTDFAFSLVTEYLPPTEAWMALKEDAE